MAKGEILFEQFLLLSQCFQKLSAAEAPESVNMRKRVIIVDTISYVLNHFKLLTITKSI